MSCIKAMTRFSCQRDTALLVRKFRIILSALFPKEDAAPSTFQVESFQRVSPLHCRTGRSEGEVGQTVSSASGRGAAVGGSAGENACPTRTRGRAHFRR